MGKKNKHYEHLWSNILSIKEVFFLVPYWRKFATCAMVIKNNNWACKLHWCRQQTRVLEWFSAVGVQYGLFFFFLVVWCGFFFFIFRLRIPMTIKHGPLADRLRYAWKRLTVVLFLSVPQVLSEWKAAHTLFVKRQLNPMFPCVVVTFHFTCLSILFFINVIHIPCTSIGDL